VLMSVQRAVQQTKKCAFGAEIYGKIYIDTVMDGSLLAPAPIGDERYHRGI